MSKYLQFAIEDINLIEETSLSQFATAKIQAFSSDKNRHDLICEEETLIQTAPTIYNKPILYSIDNTLDDFYTHVTPEKSLICGFVVPDSAEFTRLSDSRLALNVTAKIWKRYAPKVMDLFKRDKGNKKVSVELELFDAEPIDDVFTKMISFAYTGICILGNYVAEASPGANMEILSFSDIKSEYEKDYEKEFSFNSEDLFIPQSIKDNAQRGFKLKKEGIKTTSTGLAFGSYLSKNDVINEHYLNSMLKYFSEHSEETSSDNADWYLFGGKEGELWAKDVFEKIKNNKLITFPYKSTKEINPALKGIEPPLSLGQANQIARQADAIGVSGEKNGWAIAISSFKKTHKVENGRWVKIINSDKSEKKEEIFMEEDKTLMAKPLEEKKEEAPVEEGKEVPAEEQKVEKKFEFPKNINKEKMSTMFSDDGDEDDEIKMAKEEMCKGEFASPEILMSGMFAKMCKMAEIIAKMAEKEKTYMSKNEELEKFKADVEKSQKAFAVEKTLQELAEKVILPDDAKTEMITEAEKYSFSELESWRNYCKAKSFDFAVKDIGKQEIVRVGLPVSGATQKKQNDLWS